MTMRGNQTELGAKLLPKLVAPGFSSVDILYAPPTIPGSNHRAYLIVTIDGTFLTRTSCPFTSASAPSTVADRIGCSSGL